MMFGLAVIGCRKDIEEDMILVSTFTPPVILVDGTVYGRVVDEDGLVLANVLVKMGNQTRNTNENGFFCI